MSQNWMMLLLLHLNLLSIDTMKFESLAVAHLLDCDADDEVFAINFQIETVLSLKMFMMHF